MSRPARMVAVVAAIIIGGTACSSNSNTAEEPAPTTTSTSSEFDGSQPTDANPSGSELSAQLDTALVGLLGEYHFSTRIELEGQLVTEVVGDNIAGASEFTIATSGTTLEVVSVDGQVWSRPQGGTEWVAQPASDISTDPLGPLLDASSRTVAGEQITVVYPGASFGLKDPFIDVLVRVDGNAVELVHQAGTVIVRSRLEPSLPNTVVTAPG